MGGFIAVIFCIIIILIVMFTNKTQEETNEEMSSQTLFKVINVSPNRSLNYKITENKKMYLYNNYVFVKEYSISDIDNKDVLEVIGKNNISEYNLLLLNPDKIFKFISINEDIVIFDKKLKTQLTFSIKAELTFKILNLTDLFIYSKIKNGEYNLNEYNKTFKNKYEFIIKESIMSLLKKNDINILTANYETNQANNEIVNKINEYSFNCGIEFIDIYIIDVKVKQDDNYNEVNKYLLQQFQKKSLAEFYRFYLISMFLSKNNINLENLLKNLDEDTRKWLLKTVDDSGEKDLKPAK